MIIDQKLDHLNESLSTGTVSTGRNRESPFQSESKFRFHLVREIRTLRLIKRGAHDNYIPHDHRTESEAFPVSRLAEPEHSRSRPLSPSGKYTPASVHAPELINPLIRNEIIADQLVIPDFLSLVESDPKGNHQSRNDHSIEDELDDPVQ